MNYEKQLSVMAAQFRACFTADKWLWARILLFIFFGFAFLIWSFLGVVLIGFFQRMLGSVGDELDHFVSDERRSSLVRAAMLFVVCPVALIRYVFVPFISMATYICNFCFNVSAYIVSLSKSGWHGSLQYNELVAPESPPEEAEIEA